jgi:hypothetical protein
MHNFIADNNFKINNTENKIPINELNNCSFNIMMPYSMFSISEIEAKTFAPTIYPSDNFIVNNNLIDQDRKLYPLFASKEMVDKSEFLLKGTHIGGPQDDELEVKKYWISKRRFIEDSSYIYDTMEDITYYAKNTNFDEERNKNFEKRKQEVIDLIKEWTIFYENSL